MKSIYLDHQSTTPLRTEVLAALQPFLVAQFGNASSLHRLGLEARDALEHARQRVATFIQAGSHEEIIFTSGGTEATNLAIKGAAWAGRRRGNHLVVSATEHPAVLRSVEFLEAQGFRSTKIKVNSLGTVAESISGCEQEGFVFESFDDWYVYETSPAASMRCSA